MEDDSLLLVITELELDRLDELVISDGDELHHALLSSGPEEQTELL